MKHRPSWACPDYDQHVDTVCPECLRIYESTGRRLGRRDMPPRVVFGQGWFSIGAVHWFPATDDAVFPSRDGKRVLAQAICGGICDVTICGAPRAGEGWACKKCLRALEKARSASPDGVE